MTPNMQQQQQSGPQQPSVPAQGQQQQINIQAGQVPNQPNHIPAQFPGYGSGEHNNANAAPFIYTTNQRINMPHQSQQANPSQQGPAASQAPSHPHAYGNGQYMYQQPYGYIGHYDPMVAQQYINAQSGGYTPQGYIYAQNPSAVNMYNQSKLRSFFFV